MTKRINLLITHPNISSEATEEGEKKKK